MKKLGFVYDDSLVKDMCKSKKFGERMEIVMDLMRSYGLFRYFSRIPPLNMESFESDLMTILGFFSEEYIRRFLDFARSYEEALDSSVLLNDSLEEFGLSYDCSGFEGVYSYAMSSVRGTIAAVDALLKNQCTAAINWFGGWHHGKRASASGFCYFNDIGIAIMRILQKDPTLKILYIDLDLHHGDGVEEAFAYSRNVVTFSVHHAARGFYPGTGNCDSSSGYGPGRFSAFNFPMNEGATDENFIKHLPIVLSAIEQSLKPNFVILQLGADGLCTDPHKIFNLTASSQCAFVHLTSLVLSWNLPTLILGGGGYNFPDTARLWTCVTHSVIQHFHPETYFPSQNLYFSSPIEIKEDIPEINSFKEFGPDFTLSISPGLRPNKNTEEYLETQVKRLLCQLEEYKVFRK
ncbi:Histone deacetylase 8 [Cichlidogyrus casuarinus]|uniref:histone deacetylase n=1 Tax=Cichlidogyrus casuarinus TaxID=1844966 RepID=A0ABD2QGK5_9PLAT